MPSGAAPAPRESEGSGGTHAPGLEEVPAADIDDAAESAFLAEARERGEVVAPAKPAEVESIEDSSPQTLPPLNDLVNRIPPEVRETLEDLFRARFTVVKRFPKKALKS